jgi:beta-lactamase regulating signal transducer with metallopeptidase domain
MALERVVQVFESTAIAVPMMVGWLKPVVLLPAAALSGLTSDQIEALLAHELAHVRRHDYLVNLLQAAVETLLFYHPAVWWVSRHVRQEREHCCDDLAIAVCGDRAAYAAALADLAAMTTPRFALAASDGSLLARVKRILGPPADRHSAPVGWTPALLVALLGAALVPLLAHGERNAALATDTSAVGVQTPS